MTTYLFILSTKHKVRYKGVSVSVGQCNKRLEVLNAETWDRERERERERERKFKFRRVIEIGRASVRTL